MRNVIENIKEKYEPDSDTYDTALLMEEFLNNYIEYVKEHPEYYGCMLD